MKIPSPPVNPENKPFFDAAREGQLLLGKCSSCGGLHYYPRAICPFCFNEKIQWVEAKGKGTLYSYSVMRRVPVPYAIAYVTLDEGVTMLTNMVDCDLDRLRIGDAVRLVFKAAEGGEMIPMFTK
jgi:uncharacterized OB-fold protein